MNTKRIAQIRVSRGYHILPVKPGMQLELHEHVGEGNTKRIWRFKGLVIKVKKKNHSEGTFMIRGKTAGHTIEKIYPLSFPNFEKVVLLDQYKIRRAKLYYIREKVGKDARMKSILTNADKGVDLLALAKEEIEALQKAYEEANQESEQAIEAGEEGVEEKVTEAQEQATQVQEAEEKQEETQQEEAATEIQEVEQAQETEEQQEESQQEQQEEEQK